MSIAQREEESLRIKQVSAYSEINEQLEQQIQADVLATVQATLEECLQAEVTAHLATLTGAKPRRSGTYRRSLNTRYGHIPDLAVPKLRTGNRARQWTVLTRYQRSQSSLLDYASYLYVMGLSLRDLQEAVYLLMDHMLSRSVVNQVTLRMEERMQRHRHAPLKQTPPVLIVDGVWVTIQYTLDEFMTDRAGHQRQRRQAQERVILAATAVWPDGSHQILHYMVTAEETTATWYAFFSQMLDRHLDPAVVELVVSDGSNGLLAAMERSFPHAVQQRCITHKVRGMDAKLTFTALPDTDDAGQPLSETQAKKLRRFRIKRDAYAIYEAPSRQEALAKLDDFIQTWQPLEPDAVKTFTWGINRTFEFYRLDVALHPLIRTTNLLERFFREFRTKADEIGAFPNEDSCLTLFFLVMQREHAKHDRLAVANNS